MCSATVTKYLLFFFNLVFWLIGVFLIAIGVWAQADENFVNVVSRFKCVYVQLLIFRCNVSNIKFERSISDPAS